MIEQTELLRNILYYEEGLELTISDVDFYRYRWFAVTKDDFITHAIQATYHGLFWIGQKDKDNENTQYKQDNDTT